ncbi:MAG: hypothetical protein V4844_04345 [Pseudomonadota bacterium]
MDTRRTRREKTDSYQVLDSLGAIHAVDILTEFVEDSASGLARWTRATESHKLAATGHHVNLNDDGSLEDVRTGMPLERL